MNLILDSSMYKSAYIDIVAEKLKRERGSLSTNIAVCYVGLNAQDATNIIGRHDMTWFLVPLARGPWWGVTLTARCLRVFGTVA
jgi:hypothetical protein